jgi:hypothetical protein
MKKMFVSVAIFCVAFTASQLHAQSINNRNWQAVFGDPINDTLTFHVHSDSSFVQNSKGEVLIRTNCMITGDTLTLLDQVGEHACPDAKGKYKINLSGNTFTLTLLDDACEGRGQALNGVKWTEAMKK